MEKSTSLNRWIGGVGICFGFAFFFFFSILLMQLGLFIISEADKHILQQRDYCEKQMICIVKWYKLCICEGFPVSRKTPSSVFN